MTTMNPFDLLDGVDDEDTTGLLAAAQLKIEKEKDKPKAAAAAAVPPPLNKLAKQKADMEKNPAGFSLSPSSVSARRSCPASRNRISSDSKLKKQGSSSSSSLDSWPKHHPPLSLLCSDEAFVERGRRRSKISGNVGVAGDDYERMRRPPTSIIAEGRLTTKRVICSVSERICGGVIDKHGRRCNPDLLRSNASQEDILKTFTYDVPFDFNLENGETLEVFSYFGCNYEVDGGLDERGCRKCMHRGIKNLRGCSNSSGAVSSNKDCCISPQNSEIEICITALAMAISYL
ncbi:hypothetical protein LINPERHAP1_LOCUS27298 [Linum perenne]